MRVILRQTVFDMPQVPLMELVALIHACSGERHALVTNPPFHADGQEPINHWLEQHDERLRIQLKRVLEDGLLVASQLSAGVATIVVHEESASRWNTNQPCLAVAEALTLVQAPLRLLIENHRNDGAFLRRMATPAWRRWLEQALGKRWIEFEHAGGIGEMSILLQDVATDPGNTLNAWVRRLRLWVMFDRDSDPQDRSRPSQQSQNLKALCKSIKEPWPLAFHQLDRRAIENYLPKHTLFAWAAQGRGVERNERRRQVEAFCGLKSDVQRHQFNMKRGLLGDADGEVRKDVQQRGRYLHDAEVDPLYRDLSDEVRQTLQMGFGDHIAELFHDAEMAREEWIQKEIPSTLREDLLRSIFERM